MRIKGFPLVVLLAAPLIGGAFVLELANPQANPEATAKGAVLVARVAGCHDPAKAVITATAENMVSGKRQSAALTVIPLATPGTIAVKREWPATESRIVRLVAKEDGLTTSVLVRMDGDSFDRANVKYLIRATGEEDLAPMLAGLSRN
jgi:hypothetical protein